MEICIVVVYFLIESVIWVCFFDGSVMLDVCLNGGLV